MNKPLGVMEQHTRQ